MTVTVKTIKAEAEAKLANPEGRNLDFIERGSDLENEIKSLYALRNPKADQIETILNMFNPNSKSFVLSDNNEKKLKSLSAEVKELDEKIKELKAIRMAKADNARRVKVKSLAQANSAYAGIYLKETPVDPGITFARYARAIAIANGNLPQALEIAKAHYGEDNIISLNLKAAVAAGTTTNPTWAKPLVDEYSKITSDFVEYLRPRTILGQFGFNGIPSLRHIPFNVTISGQVSGGDGYWVGEGQAKPLTKFDFNEIKLGHAKVANICVVTEELLRFGVPQTEEILRDQLAAALIERMDKDFIDPNKALVPLVSPASITNDVDPIISSGNGIDEITADVKALFAQFLTNNLSVSDSVFIMSSTLALSLSLMTNVLGQREFPNMRVDGGSFFGIPVIVSQYAMPGTVILLNAKEIYIADDGFVQLAASREASIEMDDAPSHYSAVVPNYTPDHGPSFGRSLVSMFQTNSVALRAERHVNWTKRRPNAVSYLTGATWGNIN